MNPAPIPWIGCGAGCPPEITGDGRSTIAQLAAALDRSLPPGVSASTLAGLSPDVIPTKGERIALPGRRNLSAGGGIERVSDHAPAPLAALAVAATHALGLRIGAVDLFDLSSAGDFTDPVIIEMNGNPGLRTLELAGREDLIRKIWMSMFEECLGSKGS